MVTLGIKISMCKFELTQTLRPQHCKITCVYIPIRVKGIQQRWSLGIKKILEINKGVIKIKKKERNKYSDCITYLKDRKMDDKHIVMKIFVYIVNLLKKKSN